MPARGFFRGWPEYWDEKEQCWRYSDTGEKVSLEKARPCKRCGRVFQGSNHGDADPCLGTLPGVDNACCGHGIRDESYIRFENGMVVRGFIIESGGN